MQTLRIGAEGPLVVALQRALTAAGIKPGLVPDGKFGKLTRSSVMCFQTGANLPITGELDLATATALHLVPPEPGPPGAFGRALLAAALADLGVREAGGHNRGVRIDEYNRTAGVALGSDYCGPAIMTWLLDAARASGIAPRITGSPAAKAFETQLRDIGRWVPRDQLAGRVGPGWILVFDRRPPALEWQGHVGVVEHTSGEGAAFVVHLVEANGGPRSDGVDRVPHPISDPLLRGGGSID